MDLAALMKALLTDVGMLQEEIAPIIGVGQSSVSRISTGQQDPAYTVGLRIIELAEQKGLLTNKSGTFKVTPFVEVRGRMGSSDEIEPACDGSAIQQAQLPMGVPDGCFAIIVEADGATPRARKGDLLIAGPTVSDPSSMLEAEGVYRLEDGRCFYGTLIEGRDPEHFTILCQHNRRVLNVVVAEAGPFFSVVAAGRWQLMA